MGEKSKVLITPKVVEHVECSEAVKPRLGTQEKNGSSGVGTARGSRGLSSSSSSLDVSPVHGGFGYPKYLRIDHPI